LGSPVWKALTNNPDIFLKRLKNITHPTFTIHSMQMHKKDANCYNGG